VFATVIEGLKSCTVPITTPELGCGRYRVRLGFVAPPGDRPGQRAFDVKLNGKVVLAGLDPAKEAGGPDRAIWKEFAVDIDADLILELVAKSSPPRVGQMPIISGMQVLRDQR